MKPPLFLPDVLGAAEERGLPESDRSAVGFRRSTKAE